MIKSFETRARHLGYDAILSDTNYDPRRTREAAERMMEHKVRGVAIMTSEISLRLIHELARRRIAVTFLDLAPVAGLRKQFADRLFFREWSRSSTICTRMDTGELRSWRGAGTEVERRAPGGVRKVHAGVGVGAGTGVARGLAI